MLTSIAYLNDMQLSYLTLFVMTSLMLLMSVSQPDRAQRHLLGAELTECVNIQQGYIGNSKSLGYRSGHAYPFNEGRHRYEVISGRVGGHVTWMVIVDTHSPQSFAYESLGFTRFFFKSLSRNEAPKQVWKALKGCGVELAGVFPFDGTTIGMKFDGYTIPKKHEEPVTWKFPTPEEVNQYFE